MDSRMLGVDQSREEDKIRLEFLGLESIDSCQGHFLGLSLSSLLSFVLSLVTFFFLFARVFASCLQLKILPVSCFLTKYIIF